MMPYDTDKSSLKVTISEVDEIIKWHDSDMALLFLYSHRYPYSEETVARKLIWTMRQVRDTKEKLDRIGLGKAVATAPGLDRPTVDKILAFQVEDLARYFLYVCAYGVKDDRHAASLLNCSKEHIEDLKKKLSYLGLVEAESADAGEESGEDYSSIPGFDPSAFDPVENFSATDEEVPASKVTTVSETELSVTAVPATAQPDPKAERKELIRAFAAEVKIRDRQLNPMERKYICSWIDYGFFDPQVIGIAYRRTVKNQGEFRWPYANAIIKSWNSQKLFTISDILEYDKRHRSTSSASKAREAERAARKKKDTSPKGSGATEADYDLDSMLKRISGGTKGKPTGAEK